MLRRLGVVFTSDHELTAIRADAVDLVDVYTKTPATRTDIDLVVQVVGAIANQFAYPGRANRDPAVQPRGEDNAEHRVERRAIQRDRDGCVAHLGYRHLYAEVGPERREDVSNTCPARVEPASRRPSKKKFAKIRRKHSALAKPAGRSPCHR